jgi:hypothetical protein
MAITRAELAPLVQAWEQGQDQTESPRIRAMIDEERKRIHREFAELPIRIKFVSHDPYASFEQMRDQVQSTGQMLVWTGASETPLWDEKTNWMARAVHDWDHLVHQADFGMEGEAMVTRKAVAAREKLAPLYLSEVMLQAAVQNFTGQFSKQKLVLLDPATERYVLSLRGVGDVTKQSDATDLVWMVAGLLKFGKPELAMVHLGAMDVPESEALVVLDAARELNQSLQPARVPREASAYAEDSELSYRVSTTETLRPKRRAR